MQLLSVWLLSDLCRVCGLCLCFGKSRSLKTTELPISQLEISSVHPHQCAAGDETATETDVESQTAPAPGGAAPGARHAIPTHVLEVERQLDSFLPTEVQEQRMSGLIQSLLCAACLGEPWLVDPLPAQRVAGVHSLPA